MSSAKACDSKPGRGSVVVPTARAAAASRAGWARCCRRCSKAARFGVRRATRSTSPALQAASGSPARCAPRRSRRLAHGSRGGQTGLRCLRLVARLASQHSGDRRMRTARAAGTLVRECSGLGQAPREADAVLIVDLGVAMTFKQAHLVLRTAERAVHRRQSATEPSRDDQGEPEHDGERVLERRRCTCEVARTPPLLGGSDQWDCGSLEVIG